MTITDETDALLWPTADGAAGTSTSRLQAEQQYSNAVSAQIDSMLASPSTAPLLTRERVSPLYFFSYTFIPLSSIAFQHIGIFCLTARRLGHFRKTIVLYPLCMIAIWLP